MTTNVTILTSDELPLICGGVGPGPNDTVREQIEAMRRQQERQMIIDMFGSQENVAA